MKNGRRPQKKRKKPFLGLAQLSKIYVYFMHYINEIFFCRTRVLSSSGHGLQLKMNSKSIIMSSNDGCNDG
jgi:hypothetical protein